MWTYDPSELDKTTEEGRKNIVRLLIGDTDSSDPQVQDEEIAFYLEDNPNKIYSAAAGACFTIYSKYTRMVNTELDEAIRADYSDLAKNYKALLSDLEEKANKESAVAKIVVSGTSLQCGEIWRDRFKNPLGGSCVSTI